MSMLLTGALLVAMVAPQAPAPPKENEQFNFWIGEWEASGKALSDPAKNQWQDTKGTNKIVWTLDKRVVEENFSGAGLVGRSWSVYIPAAKKWRQTWVDNQGGYITLEGQKQGDKMILMTLANPKQPKQFSRMVFSKIQKNSFSWDWEKSSDGGKTWTLQWHLDYKRKA